MEYKNPAEQTSIRFEKFIVKSLNLNIGDDYDVLSNKNLSIAIRIKNGSHKTNPNNYALRIKVDVKSPNDELTITLESLCIFTSAQPVTKEFIKSSLVNINSAAIAFPFLRSYIHSLTALSGIHPIILPSYNFNTLTPVEETDKPKEDQEPN